MRPWKRASSVAGRQLVGARFWWTATAFLLLLASLANAASNPAPMIDQPLAPAAAVPGGAAFTVHVRGAGFVSNSTINWNGTALATTVVNSTQLTATVPAADIASPGTTSVTVVNPAPGGGVSNTVFFQVIQSTPTVVMLESDISLSVESLDVLTADFNHDGKMDLASVSFSNNTVSILLGNGDGTFQAPVNYTAPNNGPEANWMTVGDFDGDGNLDLAVCTGDGIGSGFVYLLLGNGDGTFRPPTTPFPANGSAVVIASADFNRDGKLDLVVGYEAGNKGFLSIALGNGNGSFGPWVDYAAAGDNTSIVLGDFNNDGNVDIATSDSFGADASLLLGNGDGTFKPPSIFSDQEFPDGITAADFDGDGNLDLVLPVDFGVTVFLGNGNGTFQPGANYTCDSQPLTSSVAVGDFNGDGKLDIVLPCNGTLAVIPGNGDGTFQLPLLSPVDASNVQALTVGDFNRDGHLDVALADSTSGNSISLLLQSTLNVSPAAVGFKYARLAGMRSPPHSVTLTNFGGSTLSLGAIDVTGVDPDDFPIRNECGSALSPGQSCKVLVAFEPTNSGSRSATLSITDATLGLTQPVGLFGVGTFVTVLPRALDFGDVPVGQTSQPQTTTLSNTGPNTLHIKSIVVGGADPGDFSQMNNCGSSVPPGGSCKIQVKFTPTEKGIRHGTVVVTDDGGGSPQAVHLAGDGT